MSFDDLFGPSQGNPNKKPERFAELPKRAAPEPPRAEREEPWFVTPDETDPNAAARKKQLIKKLVSIAFPILGLTVLGFLIATLIRYVVGIYE